MRYIKSAITAGGVLTMSSPMPGKTYFRATMNWKGEDPISGRMTLDPITAMENLEVELEKDAGAEAPAPEQHTTRSRAAESRFVHRLVHLYFMLRITIQLIPKGDESRARTLGTMEIANDATGTLDTGNYVGTLHAEYTRPDGRKGRVTSFNRRKQSVWSLVGAFLKLWGHTAHSPREMSKVNAADHQQPKEAR